jgi:hypothetical protein
MTVEQLPCQRTPPLLREETEAEMRRRQDKPQRQREKGGEDLRGDTQAQAQQKEWSWRW